jgi:hypothetical protein
MTSDCTYAGASPGLDVGFQNFRDTLLQRAGETESLDRSRAIRQLREAAEESREARANRILDEAEGRPHPWFTEPRPPAPNQDDGVIVYLGGLPIRTVAQLQEDASQCSRCLKRLVDNDPEWWTKAGWHDPRRDLSGNPPRDEKYQFKSKFTSRRYCEPCYERLFPPPKTRTFTESSLLDRVKRPRDREPLNIILNALPGGIKGAILRYMITASAPIVLRNGLIDSIKGFERESVRKGVGSLIMDGLLDESKGPQGLDAPMLVLSAKAVGMYRVTKSHGGGWKTIYQLELDQKSAPTDNPETLADAFPGKKRHAAKWVVRETVVGPRDNDGEDRAGRDIDDAFDRADRSRGNPYIVGRTTRQRWSDCDSLEPARRQGERVDGYRSDPASTLSPLDLLIQKEEESWDCDEPGIPRTWGTLHMLPRPNPSSTPPKERRDRRKKRGVKKITGRNQGKVGECFRLIKSIFEDRPDGDRPTYAWLADKCDCDSLTPPREALKRFRKSESFKSRLHHASDSWNPPRKRRTG